MILAPILLAVVVAPDSWSSPRAFVATSENGLHAVVVEPIGSDGARFSWFAQVPAGEAPDSDALEVGVQQLLAMKHFARPRLLARATVNQIPTQVLVSDEGRGFVALGRHYGNGTGKTLMTFDSKGELQGSWSVADFGKLSGTGEYSWSISNISWRNGSWIDEETGEAVITSTHNEVFVARLDAPELRMGGLPELNRALLEGGDRKQQMALDALALHDCPELAETYARFTEPIYPMATRLRAARALSMTGDRSAGPLIMDVAFRERPGQGVTFHDVVFALEDLHHYAKADVVMLLRERLRAPHSALQGPLTKALGRYGPSSAPLLVEMLQETEAPLHYRRAAATALAEAGDASSVDALLSATQSPDKGLALNALRSAAAIEGEGVAERLVPLIGTRDHFTGYLLFYFSSFRHPSAGPKLEEFLATKTAPWLRERIEKAIRFQSGEAEKDSSARPPTVPDR